MKNKRKTSSKQIWRVINLVMENMWVYKVYDVISCTSEKEIVFLMD